MCCRLEALKRDSGTDVEVAIDPEELEGLDDAQVKTLYEQRLSEERARHSREVCSEYFSFFMFNKGNLCSCSPTAQPEG